jgi:hypothetical protein
VNKEELKAHLHNAIITKPPITDVTFNTYDVTQGFGKAFAGRVGYGNYTMKYAMDPELVKDWSQQDLRRVMIEVLQEKADPELFAYLDDFRYVNVMKPEDKKGG